MARQKWLYLSFVDLEGSFLGAAYVQSSPSPLAGTTWSVNGLPREAIGQIAVLEIPAKAEKHVPRDHKYHDRLLSKEELREFSIANGDGEVLYNIRGERR
jgi:hypothetical protein